MWLNRQLFAYDYIRSTLSASERRTLDSWFGSAALYWERAVDVAIRQMYPRRNSDDYTTLGPNWQVETTRCTWYHGVTHHNGWKRVNWHEIWNNRDADMMRFAGLVGPAVAAFTRACSLCSGRWKTRSGRTPGLQKKMTASELGH